MNWREKAAEIAEKIRKYRDDKDGWKPAKKSKDTTVWWKPSPDWNGALYKAEATIHAEPETVFAYIDPMTNEPRSKWDKAVKELQMVEKIDKDLAVVRTITHSAFKGLISSRDFIDLVLTQRTDECIATNAMHVEHPNHPAGTDSVRGQNHPCAIICHKVADDPNKTQVASYIQTDLGGMLPQSLVESALPSNMCDFFSALKKTLKEDGHWKGPNDEA